MVPLGLEVEEEALKQLDIEAIGVEALGLATQQGQVRLELLLHRRTDCANLGKEKCHFQAIGIIHCV